MGAGKNCKASDNQAIAEALKTLKAKARVTAKVQYNVDPLSKYFKITNAVLKIIEGLSIPAAGTPVDVTYKYEGVGGSILSYIWIGSEATNPHPYIPLPLETHLSCSPQMTR